MNTALHLRPKHSDEPSHEKQDTYAGPDIVMPLSILSHAKKQAIESIPTRHPVKYQIRRTLAFVCLLSTLKDP
jgi:hypothetical protein